MEMPSDAMAYLDCSRVSMRLISVSGMTTWDEIQDKFHESEFQLRERATFDRQVEVFYLGTVMQKRPMSNSIYTRKSNLYTRCLHY